MGAQDSKNDRAGSIRTAQLTRQFFDPAHLCRLTWARAVTQPAFLARASGRECSRNGLLYGRYRKNLVLVRHHRVTASCPTGHPTGPQQLLYPEQPAVVQQAISRGQRSHNKVTGTPWLPRERSRISLRVTTKFHHQRAMRQDHLFAATATKRYRSKHGFPPDDQFAFGNKQTQLACLLAFRENLKIWRLRANPNASARRAGSLAHLLLLPQTNQGVVRLATGNRPTAKQAQAHLAKPPLRE